MKGIYQANTKYIHIICLLVACMSSAAILLAFLDSQARLDVSDVDFLLILSVLATESPPTLGWACQDSTASR